MKDIFKAAGITALAFAATGCTNDNTLDKDDLRHEEYVKNFIEAFGIPDPDHNYAMAQSAGLHITTKKGGHVTVTAFVGETEYLFADLDVTPGTHALPVTIPASVKELNVTYNNYVSTVATDATVDLDNYPAPGSRAGSYLTYDSTDGPLTFVDKPGENGWPYVVFEPEMYIKQFLEANPDDGNDHTDFSYETTQINSPYREGESITIFNNYWDRPDETILTSSQSSNGDIYYIFPIYWKRNANGNKDYQTYLHRAGKGENDITGEWRLPFGDEGEMTANIPFPHLGYSTTVTNKSEIDLNNLKKNFSFDDGDFDEAYDPNEATMVVSRGVKLTVRRDLNDPSYYRPKIAFAVRSDIVSDDNYSFSSSAPFYNAFLWGKNYYDVPLHNLYLAHASTKKMIVRPDETNCMNLYDGAEDLNKFMPGGDNYNKYDTWYKDGSFFGKTNNRIILGFNGPAARPADTTPRSYNDVILLIIPKSSFFYHQQYTDLKPEFEWTLAAEDLGGSDDWDFNDVVFTFTDVIRNLKSANHLYTQAIISGPYWAQSMRIITVTPKATGGTMPIYITFSGKNVKPMPELPSDGDEMFSDVNARLVEYYNTGGKEGTFILGTEVHKWLGASHYTQFVNVGENRVNVGAKPVQFTIPTDLDIDDKYQLDYVTSASKTNQTMFGFAVLVDKDNLLDIDTFNDEDQGFRQMENIIMGEGDYLIGAPSDDKGVKVPQMILVKGDWEWPTERTSIIDAYPNFKDWVEDHTNTDWITTPDPAKVTKK